MKISSDGMIVTKQLAEHLCVDVLELSTHPTIPSEIKNFWKNNNEDVFSALTLPLGNKREVIHNDYHHPNRQNANIAHELAHIILGHGLSVPILPNGKRDYDREVEEEAKVLSTAILIPKTVAVSIIERGISLEQASDEYLVSKQLLEYRIRKTDARRYVYNRRKKWRS
ncbi:ImmA/IrrE family metallo-endopeptidase [Amylibacter sp. IMCC11727]|uniref:ImmA/IrrE family metallo-endopeptidase n=1 Tax=Amylibacter sp. IMCC11727 TaxID=3039851 RepID=UPI00244DAA6F|nr:ImmA/IrrE family metallo-endopeptidase [Amylibacter sp. IMCC11727]WGI21173.1 ImmA/IrrE family metallo-endopeptidase [Amylibacter sp. IMCC11727]